MITVDPDLIRDTLGLLDQKQQLVDTLVRLMDAGAPDLLADDVRESIERQSRETRDIIARVQEAFLP